jgi:GNAT superfamily N-acetyltransferase
MITLDQAYHTERVILEAIATFSDHGDYLVYRSTEFPSYYAGNGLRLLAGERSLTEWEEVFNSHFDPAATVHKTFTFEEHSQFRRLVEEAREKEYHIERDVWMSCEAAPKVREVPKGYNLVHITTEKQWGKLAAFLLDSYKEYNWYDPNYKGPDRLYEKMRAAADRLDVRWYALENASGEFASKAGYFVTGNVARLQDVATRISERRKGLCSVLLSHILRMAFERKVDAVVLTTDADYHAMSLYEKLRFKSLGHTIELMNYPKFETGSAARDVNAPE